MRSFLTLALVTALVVSPLRGQDTSVARVIRRNERLLVLALRSLAAAVIADHGVRGLVRDDFHLGSPFRTVGTALGSPFFMVPVLGGTYLLGKLTDDSRLNR